MHIWKGLAAAVIAALPTLSHAQSVMLDEELTHASNQLTAPLRPSLAPQTSVHFALVDDPAINAFVTGENVVYLHSGLILTAQSAAELQGVLAHELGHIAGHHLLQQYGNARQATIGALAGAVLGIGAAVAGAPQAATAIAMGSQAGAIQSMLAHTRTQESEADRHAINALHAAGLSAHGMVDMFAKLRTDSQLSYDAPPQWLVTHPLPPERLANLEQVVSTESPNLKTTTTVNYPRLQAKIMALTATPGAVLRKYNGADDVSRYARAIAYLRQGKLDFAASNLAPLLKSHPQDAFYQEVSGQIAVQQGNLGAANTIFTKLTAAQPNALLFRYQLAEVLRNQNDFTGALSQYQNITRQWPEWSEPWQGLGLTLGALGRITESHLAMAESSLAAGDLPGTRQRLALARTYLKQTPSPQAQQWADTLQNRLDALK